MNPTIQRCTWSVCLACAVACGSDDDDDDATPAPPPLVTIAGLQPVGGPEWEAGETCVELGRDAPNQTVLILVSTAESSETELSDWALRPAESCGGTVECGHLVARIDPRGSDEQLLVRAATAAVPVPMGQLDSPLGEHTFRVELVQDDGSPELDPEGVPIAAEVTVNVAAAGECDATSNGGAGGAAGAGATLATGAAGAAGSGTAGQGGSPGQATAGTAGEGQAGAASPTAGSPGQAGVSGVAGTAGAAAAGQSGGDAGGGAAGAAGVVVGTAGAAGVVVGTAGAAGVAGTAGAAGVAGMTGAAGVAGTAGAAGLTDAAGAGGAGQGGGGAGGA